MIPFLDLKAQYASIQDELIAAATDALASTQYTLGSQVAAFEEEFGIEMEEDAALAVQTVGDAAEFIGKYVK